MLEHRGKAIYDPIKKADAFGQHYGCQSPFILGGGEEGQQGYAH